MFYQHTVYRKRQPPAYNGLVEYSRVYLSEDMCWDQDVTYTNDRAR